MSTGGLIRILISNSTMATFTENTHSQFTTLLPPQLNLSGSWQIALSEKTWLAPTQNITSGHFYTTCRRRRHQKETETRTAQ